MKTRVDNDLKGTDIILNLKEIIINARDSRSSSSCSGHTSFYFDTSTKHGYMEDPDMTGKIKILNAGKKKDGYVLHLKFKKEKDEY